MTKNTRSFPPSALPGDTLPALFRAAAMQWADQVWLRQKQGGVWRTWTWAEVAGVVHEVAGGLLSLGFQTAGRAAIVSSSRAEWVWADLAVLACGGATVGVDTGTSAQTLAEVSAQCATSIVFVEDDEQLDKALSARADTGRPIQIVVFSMQGLRELDTPGVISLDALRALGRSYNETHPHRLQDLAAQRDTDELAAIVYTAGATGNARGTQHSHRAILCAIRSAESALPQDTEDDRICFFSMSLVMERVGGFYRAIATGTRLNFVENPETVAENLREVGPTVFAAVPRVWEKLYSSVMARRADTDALQRYVFDWAMRIGAQAAQAQRNGTRPSTWIAIRHVLARWLALNGVRKFIGIHRARYLVSCAAPISPELVGWYFALGVPMLEVWGMAESVGPVAATSIAHSPPGSVGRVFDNIRVRTDPGSGELLVQSEAPYLGYLDTSETVATGGQEGSWLQTGDLGQIDPEGWIRLDGRRGIALTTANGRVVQPTGLENALRVSPYITDAILVGEGRPWLSAVVLIEQEAAEKFAQERQIPFGSFASLTRTPEIRQLIGVEIAKAAKSFSEIGPVNTFHLLDVPLAAGDAEMTPTMRLRRAIVEHRNAVHIDAMYAATS